MAKHIVLTFIGLTLGIALVAWTEPSKAGGTTFIIVVAMLAVNAAGAIATWVVKARVKPAAPPAALDRTSEHPRATS